jgi:hypothetical protein
MYQSVALSVLSCFVADEEIMTNPSVLFNLPELLGTGTRPGLSSYSD